ncbi:MAG: hypothetical protein NWE75_06925 [Candidatus Bathyarchaeota archaeon]|nr:hypothetical protein [Candidatus Bathyarchaeota archaeon]
MDEAFEDVIVAMERIAGEWGPKGIGDDSGRPHGFEYRGLPATAPKLEVAETALRILRESVASV